MTVGRDVWDDAFVVVGGRNRGAATTLKICKPNKPYICPFENRVVNDLPVEMTYLLCVLRVRPKPSNL